jgi:hypothetical protein
MDPQLIEVIAVVQALLEYTPTFGPAVIVPEDDTLWVTVIAANVKPATATATAVNITIKYFEVLAIAMLYFHLRYFHPQKAPRIKT